MLVVAGCGPGNKPELTYQPPFVPVQISINTDGEISVGPVVGVVTPLGVFEVSADVYSTKTPSDGALLLVIRHHAGGTIVDDAFQVGADEVVVTLDGHTVVAVTNRRVFIDATDGVAHSIEIRSPEAMETAGLPDPGYDVVPLPISEWTTVGDTVLLPGERADAFTVLTHARWGGVQRVAYGCDYVLRGEARLVDGEGALGFGIRTNIEADGDPFGLGVEYDSLLGYTVNEYPGEDWDSLLDQVEAEPDGDFHTFAIGAFGDRYIAYVDGVRVGWGDTEPEWGSSHDCGGLYLRAEWDTTVEFRTVTVQRIRDLGEV